MRIQALILFIALIAPSMAQAATGCTLIVSYPSAQALHEDGDCDQQQSPASSFKTVLAVIGFDSGLLKDEHTPSLPYQDLYNSDMEIQKKTTDPTIWLKESIVWYSQQLTLKLGADKFKAYVDQFDYGNRDVSGNPGKNDGLTQSWLGSSLKISPHEQVVFMTKLLSHNLGVSNDATAKTLAIMPEFSSADWKVFGKTGTNWLRKSDGEYDRSKPIGWFVGWAEKDGRKIVFAKLIRGDEKWDEYGGPKAREEFLVELGKLNL
jgi:beta-lactamase class D